MVSVSAKKVFKKISCLCTFNTVNGELVSCLGSNGNASETNDRDRDFVLELREKSELSFFFIKTKGNKRNCSIMD
jgi:hypothetical protein